MDCDFSLNWTPKEILTQFHPNYSIHPARSLTYDGSIAGYREDNNSFITHTIAEDIFHLSRNSHSRISKENGKDYRHSSSARAVINWGGGGARPLIFFCWGGPWNKRLHPSCRVLRLPKYCIKLQEDGRKKPRLKQSLKAPELLGGLSLWLYSLKPDISVVVFFSLKWVRGNRTYARRIDQCLAWWNVAQKIAVSLTFLRVFIGADSLFGVDWPNLLGPFVVFC